MQHLKATLIRLPQSTTDYLNAAAEQTRRSTGKNACPSATVRAVVAATVAAGIDLTGTESEVHARVSDRLAGSV